MDAGVVQTILHFIPFSKIVTHAGHLLLTNGTVLVAIFLAELLAGADRQRYRSRNFFLDAAHYIFYNGGFFLVLIYNPLFAVLGPGLSIFKGNILMQMPPLWAYLLYLLYFDFMSYWFHRLLHANRFLWAFHSVHHTPTQLTTVTASRRHLGEIILASLFTYIVLAPLGSITSSVWPVLVLVWVVRCLDHLQHAELPWRFGLAYRILVNPVFHAIHHSVDPAYHHKNYAIVFSFWDYLFGTAADSQSRPQVYGGVEGMGMSESLTGLVMMPCKNFVNTFSAHRRSVMQEV